MYKRKIVISVVGVAFVAALAIPVLIVTTSYAMWELSGEAARLRGLVGESVLLDCSSIGGLKDKGLFIGKMSSARYDWPGAFGLLTVQVQIRAGVADMKRVGKPNVLGGVVDLKLRFDQRHYLMACSESTSPSQF